MIFLRYPFDDILWPKRMDGHVVHSLVIATLIIPHWKVLLSKICRAKVTINYTTGVHIYDCKLGN